MEPASLKAISGGVDFVVASAVSDGGLDAHDRVAGENAGLHGLLDAGVDGADVFARRCGRR